MTKRKGSLEYLARFMCPRCKRGEHHNCNDKGCECNCRTGSAAPGIISKTDDLGRLSDPKNDEEFDKIMAEYRKTEESKHKVVKQPG